MQNTGGEGIEEVFVVRTERVDFMATLVKLSEDEGLAHGRVIFEDGSRWHLESPQGEREALRAEVMTLAETFANQYGTEVFRLRFKRAVGFDEFVRHLREAKPQRLLC